MPNLAWVGQVVFFISYFVAWLVGAFDALTVHSPAAHGWIVASAIAAGITALVLLFFNGYPVVAKYRTTPAATPPAA